MHGKQFLIFQNIYASQSYVASNIGLCFVAIEGERYTTFLRVENVKK